ncbi:hypothetical protein [Streptomyces sp. NPDC021224]|uniref:hypothetical protein n=1 Tax=unclassified Streptomyces TaxID=2593676 RepID=UPI0037A97894
MDDVLQQIMNRDVHSEVAWKPTGAAHPAAHCLVFQTAPATGQFLVQFDAASPMPIPAVGDDVVLHDRHVRVLAVMTAYTRSEEDGRVQLYTDVVVDATGVNQTPLVER